MKRSLKERLCWNCEGGVSFDVEHCPFCGVYLSPLSPQESLEEKPLEEENLLNHFTSPWTPPIQEMNMQEQEQKKESPPPITEEEPPSLSSAIPPLAFFLPGTTLFLFGLTLFFIGGEGGKLVLSWQTDLSLPLLLFSSVLLFFGSRR